jgi:dTDP-4-amino-4,6-dideoxygalactose transaminase
MFISGDTGISPLFFLKKIDRDRSIEKPNKCLLFSHARGALIYYLNSIKRNENKRQILMPDYICDDLVRTVKSAGFEVEYYNITENLSPDKNNLMEKTTDKILAIIVVHYFGFFNDIDGIVDYCRQKGIYVIEDCAHVLFDSFDSVNRISRGDAAIFSLKKYFPIPDGGLLFAKDMKINAVSLERCKTKYAGLIKFFLKYILSRTIISPAKKYGDENYINESFEGIKRISSFSETILEDYIDIEYIKKRRQNNFFYYVDTLKKNDIGNKVEIMYSDLEESDAPYMFPIRLKKDNRLLISQLRGNGIPAISWPSLPEGIKNSSQHIAANNLHERVVLLPLHQDIDSRHINHIIYKLCKFVT